MKVLRRVGSGLMAAALAGCMPTLETGYEPRQLGASPAERRGYYASPFTPEAAQAAQGAPGQQQTDDLRTMRRPGAIR